MKAQEFINEYTENKKLRTEIQNLIESDSSDGILRLFEERNVDPQEIAQILQSTVGANSKLAEEQLANVEGGISGSDINKVSPVLRKLINVINDSIKNK